jgi:hypothetical protein
MPYKFVGSRAIRYSVSRPRPEMYNNFMYASLVWRWLVFVLLATILVECCAALICWYLSSSSQTSRLLWNPKLEQARINWNTRASVSDEEIGGFLASGTKNNLEFPDSSKPCGSAYGDSFIGGADVPDQEGWIEQLSHLMGCRVNDYAVGGDGTDQAYLRFRQLYDDSPLVLLGIDTHTIMNVINQYDGFLSGELEPYSLKGRFILDQYGGLNWVARPRLDANDFVAMHRDPATVLPQSYFLPDTADGPVTFRFPYAFTLARLALIPRLHNIVLRRAEWSSLYRADHPAGALQLMVAISEAFVELANSRGKRALIVMLPVAGSFREQSNHGSFEYIPLVAALRAKGIEVFDPGPAMIAARGGRSTCEFFTRPHAELAWLSSPVPCGGHYSSLGNALMAQLVAAELRRRNFLKQ